MRRARRRSSGSSPTPTSASSAAAPRGPSRSTRPTPASASDTGACRSTPVSGTVWPVSHSQGWLPKLQGTVDRTPARATLVTALVDIGRGQLAGPFARSFEDHYVPMFERLLSADLPMVIYLDLKHADIVWRRRRAHNTKVVPLTAETLRAFPYFDRVQEIRGRAEWYSQTGWLPWSPQAALEYYNPLVMSKMRWLGDQAKVNPFGTEHLFWV